LFLRRGGRGEQGEGEGETGDKRDLKCYAALEFHVIPCSFLLSEKADGPSKKMGSLVN
jgi:hypothetical protein